MAREKELFRDNLVVLREQFGETDLIPLKKVSDYIKVDDRTLKSDKAFPIKKNRQNVLCSNSWIGKLAELGQVKRK